MPNKRLGYMAGGIALIAGLCGSLPAGAQSGPRLIDTGRLDQSRPGPIGGGAVPAAPTGRSRAPSDLAAQRFVLTAIQIDGAHAIPKATLDATWLRLRGTTISVQQVYAIADAIGAAYASAGYALYSVVVPRQDFGSAPVHIEVVEGYVENVVIEGDTEGADLSLLKNYAARVVADRPLRQATLEREILLMSAIAGLTVGSRFEPMPGQPGAVRLRLGVKRKKFEAGIGFSNQGASVLGELQLSANAVANSVLHEGDRTQFVFGIPAGLSRYQYYGLNHTEPIGSDGATLTVSVGDLVTHPQSNEIGGNAFIASVQGRYPIIVGLRESLAATAELDYLNATNAFLGTTVTDERTRALRLGVNYAIKDGWDGVDAAIVTLSEGLNILGARRGGEAYGAPSFSKVNIRLAREQDLPHDLVLRARMAAQYGFEHLPASEQFAFGGPDFGQAFPTATLFGDQAVAAALELAYRFPDDWLPEWAKKSEAFISADTARLWNAHTEFEFHEDGGSSAGLGARLRLLDKVTMQAEVARALQQPSSVARTGAWRFFVAFSGTF